MWFIKIFAFLNDYTGALGILVSIFVIAWSIIKFGDYRKNRNFQIYHKLVEDLVDIESGRQDKKLDRQIAIVFELRNFRRYYEVSERILIGLKNCWVNENPRIIEEINLTLDFIKKKRRCR